MPDAPRVEMAEAVWTPRHGLRTTWRASCPCGWTRTRPDRQAADDALYDHHAAHVEHLQRADALRNQRG